MSPGGPTASRTIVTRSGRRLAFRPRRTLVHLALFVGGVLAVLLGLTSYSPLLHHFAGNRGFDLADAPRLLLTKALRDNHAAVMNVLFAHQAPQESQLPTVRVFVDQESYSSLNHDILLYGLGELSTKPRVRGHLLTDEGFYNAYVGYRGTNQWHHEAWKPSLKVRARGRRLVDGYRDQLLVAPEDPTALRNWLSGELARRWGAPTTEEEHVRLYLGGRYMGPYTRMRRLDESLLIHQGRLPGPFFRLELNTGQVFNRTQGNFFDVDAWETTAEDEDVKAAKELLDVLLRVIREPPDPARFDRVNRLIDREAMARWLALLVHAASAHVEMHNVALWLDTTSGRFVPLLMDVNGYDWSHPEEDRQGTLKVRNFISHAWLQDPRNLALYVERLRDLVTGHGSAEATVTVVREAWARIRPDALADPYTSEMGAPTLTGARGLFPVTGLDENVDELCDFIEFRHAWMSDELAGDSVFIVEEGPDSFEVLIAGSVGVEAHREETVTSLFPTVPALDLFPFEPSVLAHMSLSAYAFYRLPGRIDDYRFAHRLDGHEVIASPLPAGSDPDRLRSEQGFHPSELSDPAEAREIAIGPGNVLVTSSNLLGPETSVIVQAGTNLQLGPGVSLLFEGRVRFAGTESRPITIRPASQTEPFGVIAITGEGTRGSVLRWVDIEGGSTARLHALEFLGMLSVHDCPDFRMENSRVGRNAGGDDALHVARSAVQIRDCLFEDNLFDAVDLDDVTGDVIGCRFERSGNDGLDLSMSDVRVLNSHFDGCGDKGVSVGEGSRSLLADTRIANCEIGVAIKDRSELAMENVHLVGCGVAIDAYMKKWRWGSGGTGWLRNVECSSSTEADLRGDKKSRFLLEDGDAGDFVVAESPKIVTLEEWPAWAGR